MTKKTTTALARELLAHPNPKLIAKDLAEHFSKVTIPHGQLARDLAALAAAGTRVILVGGRHAIPHPRTLRAYLKGPPRVTEVQLAKKLGVTQSMVSRIKQHTRVPRMATLKKLVEVTGIPYEDLVADLGTRKGRRRR